MNITIRRQEAYTVLINILNMTLSRTAGDDSRAQITVKVRNAIKFTKLNQNKLQKM
jgi:hypothetical protein